LPYIMTGIRLAAAVALILAVTAELVIGAPGLGKEIGVAMSSSAVPTMYALILVIGRFAVTVNVLFRTLERRVLAWHTSVRLEAVTWPSRGGSSACSRSRRFGSRCGGWPARI